MTVLVPVTQTLVLLAPAMAAISWAAWYRGGRLWLALLWTAVAVLVLTRPLAGAAMYVAFAKGWALVLAAAFGTVAIALPRRPFLIRALAALGITVVVIVGSLGARGVTPLRVERVIGSELSDRVVSGVAALRARTSTAEWRDLEARHPERTGAVVQLISGIESRVRRLAPVGTTFFPGALLLESLAALALAWGLHHRLSRTRIGPPLAPLRSFRFEDQFIWGVISGLVMVLIPRALAWKGVGMNLLLFFGTLYALRGMGVLVWFFSFPGRWLVLAVLGVVAVVWPLLALPLPLGLGLGDTYFDWRRRVRPSNQGSIQ